MKRRNFIEILTATGGAMAAASLTVFPEKALAEVKKAVAPNGDETLTADVVVAGGGLGGFAAAMASLRNNQTVVLTEETDWVGGQLTSQGVPPDEHQWIESHGGTQFYRDFRNAIREYYKRHYPLTEEAKNKPNLNPGDGAVSRLCHEPRVAVAVFNDMMAPYISSGKLVLLLEHKITDAKASGNKVSELTAKSLRTNKTITLKAPYFVDATELGELLPLTGTEFVTGTESRKETRELHAPEKANPNSNQAFTVCFAMDYVPGENHVIEKPRDYDFWSNHIPDLQPAWAGKLLALHYSDPRTLKPKNLGFHPEGHKTGDMLNLWNYRRIINKNNFKEGTYAGDITIVNWPQNDYMLGNLIGVSEKDFNKHVDAAKQLSLSLFYWLQTEAPRPDGGKGWPGLRLRKDIMGTEDGMAKYPYIRESRRIKAVFTVLEEHVGKENRLKVAGKKNGTTSAYFYDSVGTGYYHIDLHPTSDKVNYVDFASLPFQIPLGALLPVRIENLLPANKNIGTTHITNGCFRLHPVEWNIGESVGMLIKFARSKNVIPRKVREDKALLAEFQEFIRTQGIETEWSKNTSSDEA
ncbi:FAD dependent oxidoreductase [Pontibacter mucosus]|uniref:FAD dependent oxidoreductase n=1 Tax=Pontibacter mucosus TaxID=1649266 RepID=A0A2T5YHV5_9BACT|nr:FAD-dependent oxidoreductase [Pontibacter mucosus]PTX18885.1 FAD dependent oxidoreductase [Pontibacter mucosus]